MGYIKEVIIFTAQIGYIYNQLITIVLLSVKQLWDTHLHIKREINKVL